MFLGLPVISVAIWLPILFGILVLATGDDKNAPLARMLALVGSVLGFLVTIPLYTGFMRDTSQMQFVEMHNWITRFNKSDITIACTRPSTKVIFNPS